MREVVKLTSRDNAAVKGARAVREGRDAGHIFIEGLRLSEEAASSTLAISDMFFTSGFEKDERHSKLLRNVAARAENVYEVNDSIADSLSDTRTPQGIFLVAKHPEGGVALIERNLAAGRLVVVMLQDVNNPANLGAVIRSAEAAGAAGLIVTGASAEPYSTKSLRSSMGSAFRLPVATIADGLDALRWAESRGLTSIACDVRGSAEHNEFDWRTPTMLVFGSEAHGLRGEILDAIDQKIRIDMDSGVESLNLAVSAGIVLFEARRQRTLR